MRQRNLKWAMPYLKESSKVTINYNTPQATSGFNHIETKDKTALEIGVGKGDFIVGIANLKKDYYYIGIEAQSTILGIAAKKLDERKLDNVHLVLMNAKELEYCLNPNSIDILYLNFSDPWPKVRHEKRRLTSPAFLDIYSKILKKDACIIMKTDNLDLFNYSIESLNNAKYKLEVDYDYKFDEENDAMSEYEARFRSKGNKIYRLVAKKGG